MIELKSRAGISDPIQCKGRASDGPGSPSPFAIVHVEVRSASDASAEFQLSTMEPECVDQSGQAYASHQEIGYFIRGASRGVKDAVAHYESLGVSLRGLEARLTKLVAHEVDSTERAFWSAAKNAMATCLVNCK